MARERQRVDIPPAGGRNGGGGTAGSVGLHLPPLEHSCTVYCDQAHYEPVSRDGADTRYTGIQAVVVTVQGGREGGLYGGLGGVMDRGGVGDGQDVDGVRLSQLEDNAENLT